MDPSGAVERLWPGRPARVTALSGGITNHNFRVDVEGESFVLRMGGAETDLLGIDRLAFVGKRGVACDHQAALDPGNVGRQIIGDPVGEVFLLGVIAAIGER